MVRNLSTGQYQSCFEILTAIFDPSIFVFDAVTPVFIKGVWMAALTPKNHVPVTGWKLLNSLDDFLACKPISDEQIPSI